ncbi:CocE/NonD family hydrolase [Sphingobium sp. JS3065]|uniref:CocE/NonD family hydrolase n=1 Tax=Sphingobium sp. JS3065 TaxID=2970925 RepID=UPI0022642AB4|nr:CocE/NonD family hydrolase [Sphingobium sp. JS3065]UZW56375.1 CocE/NonD family hydrolase [Sphingobium sp. JS3065]
MRDGVSEVNPNGTPASEDQMTSQNVATEWTPVTVRGVMVPMRDGVRLATDIAIPSKDGVDPFNGRFPTLILRTPYSREAMAAMPTDVVANAAIPGPAAGVRRGYVVVYQDVRGCYGSEGQFSPLVNEAADGLDTMEWIRSQPWSDGRVSFFGPSYHGGAAMAAAGQAPDGLVTAFLQSPAPAQYGGGWPYFDDIFGLGAAVQWTIQQSQMAACRVSEDQLSLVREELLGFSSTVNLIPPVEANFPGDSFTRLLKTLPIRDMPVARHFAWWREWLDQRNLVAEENDDRFARATIPMMHVGGWYDLFLRNTYEQYERLTREAASVEAREGQRMIIGPWSHVDCLLFPSQAAVDGEALNLAWMDQNLKKIRHPFFDHPVTIYVMGENRWRAEASWPLPDTERTRFYLHSRGGANTALGDGLLSTDLPVYESADQYRYDPADPVPSIGGIDLWGSRAAQSEAESRSDVLCYTSAELAEDVEVTGKITATLFAASSAEDTDWWMRLVDVGPDGKAETLSHGAVRARYRMGRARPQPLKPGEIVEYSIDMQATSNVFKKGHRIRVEVSSSCFPLGERHPNSFVDPFSATEADFVVATQTIYHDAEHASFVELPVIPLARERRWIDTPFPLAGGKHLDFGRGAGL